MAQPGTAGRPSSALRRALVPLAAAGPAQENLPRPLGTT